MVSAAHVGETHPIEEALSGARAVEHQIRTVLG
eukprot:CAMPEP_0177208558 /NCGR_PEP_ID=MMETSP0367-20130122/30556_1 /TAXON_ID=447022 ORGANISM="Scrippsiella hangoei-like, Strain SHHI-4" /NCGR_SAMPLE_ID=MMETSP0367 /ASSEMBLY_ACC=CAM_ASM_000362 /LENGTH=32 /DNA_ID= /DNA_START= /DNA_END= /DNA_ORIENTATION=